MECEKCKLQIETKYGSGRFCSSYCARSFSSALKREEINRKVSQKLSGKGRGESWKCDKCTSEFSTKASLTSHRRTHTRQWETLKKDATRKKYLLIERGHRCQICSSETWMGSPIPIEIDHIDGNSDNNEKDNLRLICPNCHAQTFFYKGRNAGRFNNTKRQNVMKRYPSYR